MDGVGSLDSKTFLSHLKVKTAHDAFVVWPKQLILYNQAVWDVRKFRENFSEDEVQNIMTIPYLCSK